MRPASAAFRSARIRQLNDAFRADIESATAAVHESVLEMFGRIGIPAVIEGVRRFDAFTPGPEDLHDNGAFELFGVAVMWSIEYADQAMRKPSPNPADPYVTKRVLVLALADEIAGQDEHRGPPLPGLQP